MQKRTGRGAAAPLFRKAIEGKIGAFNFLITLGFLLSLLLLFVSLHVHFETISRRIEDGNRHRSSLRDQKTRLISERNDLVSPERILPLAEKSGLEPGSPRQVHRVAWYEPVRRGAGGIHWASSSVRAGREAGPAAVPESR